MKLLKKWMAVVILLLVIAVFIAVMALSGWRVTYAPELENSWNAISAFGTWAGVVVSAAGVVASFVAIWYAIQVPKEIAYQQNRIALFEKRYEAYSSILTLEVFANALDSEMFDNSAKDSDGKILTIEDKVGLYCLHFATTLGFPPRLKQGSVDIDSVTQTISLLKQHEAKAMTLPVLYYKTDTQKNEMKQALSDIFEPLLCLMTEVVTFQLDEHNSINDKNRKNFIAAIKYFKRTYADEIERGLLIVTR